MNLNNNIPLEASGQSNKIRNAMMPSSALLIKRRVKQSYAGTVGMKTAAIKYLLVLFLISFSYSSCKKYPDGPLLNFTSKEERIERTWTLEYLEIGGIDSTANFLDENDSGFKFNHIRFYNERDYSRIVYSSRLNPLGLLSMNWSFTDKKRNLEIDLIGFMAPYFTIKDRIGPFWVKGKIEFRIRKLTKEELWLETTYNGALTKAHFREK
jgi:hypothetical protein